MYKSVFLIIFASASLMATALPGQQEPPPSLITADEIDKRIEQVGSLTDLSDDRKNQIREFYSRAKTELETIDATRSEITVWEAMIRSAGEEARRTQRLLNQVARGPAQPVVSRDATLADLDLELRRREDAVRAARESFAKLDAEPRRRATRKANIPEQTQAAETELRSIGNQLSALGVSAELTPLNRAQLTYQQVRQQSLQTSLELWRKEQEAYDVTAELIHQQRDAASTDLENKEKEATAWRELVLERRRRDAESQALQALSDAAKASPAAQQIAQTNANLAQERQRLAEKISRASRGLDDTQRLLAQVSSNASRTKGEVELIGLLGSAGEILFRQKIRLPDINTYRRLRKDLQRDFAALQINLYRHQDARSQLANIQAIVDSKVAEINPQPTEQDNKNMGELLRMQRDFLDSLLADDRRYASLLRQWDSAVQQLISETNQFREFLNERILWMRDDPVFGIGDLYSNLTSGLWIISPETWSESYRVITEGSLPQFFALILLAAAFASLIFFRQRVQERISSWSPVRMRRHRGQILVTLKAVLSTFAYAALWPAFLWILAWRLEVLYNSSPLIWSIAAALKTIVPISLLIQFLVLACVKDGIASDHFKWPTDRTEAVRKNSQWYLGLAIPVLFLSAVFRVHAEQANLDVSSGRLLFVVFLVVSAYFAHRVIGSRPTSTQARAKKKGELLRIWRQRTLDWIFTLLAVFLGVLALLGYYYTARTLVALIVPTLWLILFLMLLGSILQRWIRVGQRDLLAQQQAEAIQISEVAEIAGEEAAAIVEEQETATVDIHELSQQTLESISFLLLLVGLGGFWLIWADYFSALGFLTNVRLGPTETSLSLAALIGAIAVAYLAYWAAKNLPRILEFVALRRLPLDDGARYAIKTITQYIIALLGVSFVAGSLGVNWSSLQWLVAAMGVGLGFGLQEIFANFVSGLILLIERPIRVGDIITLGQTSGTVTRMRIRSTTITDWDRKDYVIPNKDLVTGQFLNWTLSNPINRIVIPVGVAYGSDVRKAIEVLLEVGRKHPLTMDEPEPSVVFQAFGQSSLDLVLRCFLPNMDNRILTFTDLHLAIDDAFRKTGIEISFPQRDLHLRSVDPGAKIALGGSRARAAQPRIRKNASSPLAKGEGGEGSL